GYRRRGCRRYALWRPRRGAPGPGDAAPALVAPGARTGAHRLHAGVRGRPFGGDRRRLALGGPAGRVRHRLHRRRGPGVRPPPGGIVTTHVTSGTGAAGPAAIDDGPQGVLSTGTAVLGGLVVAGFV